MAKKVNRGKRSKKMGGRSPYIAQKTRVMTGQQIYNVVQNGANGTQLFSGTNVQAISPDSLGTEIADVANHYNQYRFAKLEFEYVPVAYNITSSGPTGSQSNNVFAFGFEPDGQQTFTVTHGNIAALQHAILVPATGWAARRSNVLRVALSRDKWYYTKDDTTSSATIRQTIQGLLYGEALRSITDVTLYGEIWIRYTVVFRDLCPTQGVTLASILAEARLGRFDRLERVLDAVTTVSKYADQNPKIREYDDLDSLTNEEFRLVTGHGRPPPAPVSIAGATERLFHLLGDHALLTRCAR